MKCPHLPVPFIPSMLPCDLLASFCARRRSQAHPTPRIFTCSQVLHTSPCLLVLTGCVPYWLSPEIDARFQVAHGIMPETLKLGLQQAKALGRHVAGVLVVSPTYFGAASHIGGEGGMFAAGPFVPRPYQCIRLR